MAGLALFVIAVMLIGGLVVVPMLLRVFGQGNAASGPAGAPPSFGPLAFQALRNDPPPSRSLASAGRPAAAEREPDHLEDALIDVRRVERQINAATMKRFAEIVERHPEAVGAALRRWLDDRSR